MDKISILEEISKEIIELQYDDSRRADKLYSRVSVIVEKIFDSKVKYINELYAIRYLLKGINCNTIGTDKEIRWQEGKEKLENLVNTLVYDVNISKQITGEQIMSADENQSKCSKVFIVHGHDDGAVDKIARFVGKLGFEAIILHEQSSSGDTIIEKIIRYSDVGFGIVLYTECDIGAVKSQPNNLKPRARQNVIFEHGLLIGKIGRANVVALVKGDIERPNDISGVVYISLDESEGWKLSLVKEMIASGYNVDMSKIL